MHTHTHSKEENTVTDHFNMNSTKYLVITNTYSQSLPQKKRENTSQSIVGSLGFKGGICK